MTSDVSEATKAVDKKMLYPSRRDHFAGLAMQVLMRRYLADENIKRVEREAQKTGRDHFHFIAAAAVVQADAMIAELDK